MASAIRHDTLVISDADIVVDRSYLGGIVSLLGEPGVGLVTCLYFGIAEPNPWARLAAMAIDYHFLPGVLIGMKLGIAHPCFGSTIALRRSTLVQIGGFSAFAGELADDYAIGKAVRGLGQRVVVAPFLVGHRCSEGSAAGLLRHELRWARTIRSIDPAGFAGSVVTHPVPLALLACAAAGFAPQALAALVLALACRAVLMTQVDRALARPRGRAWLGPLRDLLSFFVLLASFLGRGVVWQDRRYRVHADGTIARSQGS